MNRSVGVTVIAVLSLLASGLTLLMGILVDAVTVLVPIPSNHEIPFPPAFFKGFLVLVSLVYILPAIWGIVTGVGLLHLKNWARISIIVFSVLLILQSAFSGLILLVMPALPNPGGADPSVLLAIRVMMGVFWLLQLSIGIWWLVFFTRPNVKAQFVPLLVVNGAQAPSFPNPIAEGPMPSALILSQRPQRPLSITIIAWLLLIGCAFMPLAFVLRSPAFLLTRIVSGWQADVYYLAATAVQLYIGIGLLRMWPLARKAGIWYYGALMVNAAVFNLMPGGHARFAVLFEAQQRMFPWMRWMETQPGFHFDPMPFAYIGACIGAFVIAVPIYFLVTRRDDFERAAASA